MLKIIKQLLNGSLFSIIVGFLSQPPCASANLLGPASSAHIACSVVSGRRASMSAITLEGEYIAGSLLMYSRSALTIAGVSGTQPVTGPEALASLNSSQIRANGVNASLHVTLPAGQKCLCSLSGSGVLDCSEFTAPTPPWPAYVGCQWHVAKNGMLMETNASSTNYSCLAAGSYNETTSWIDMASFWPRNVSLIYNRPVVHSYEQLNVFHIAQEFNGSSLWALIIDAIIDSHGPVRISFVHEERTPLPNGSTKIAMDYRRYLGWSRHCLHKCRIVFRRNLGFYTLGKETCEDLESPFDNATMAALATDGCVWTFTLDCTPVLVSSDDRTQLCSPSSSPWAPRFNNYRRFILQAVGKAPVTAPIAQLQAATLCWVLALQLRKTVL